LHLDLSILVFSSRALISTTAEDVLFFTFCLVSGGRGGVLPHQFSAAATIFFVAAAQLAVLFSARVRVSV
jgi:hypothetical protein